MPLFKVRFEVELMVVANSPEEAEATVLEGEWAFDEIGNGFADAHEVKSLGEVPTEWQGSFPWGGAGEKTCKQILEAQ